MDKKMSLEQILARNINAAMARTMGLDTIDKLSSKSGVGRGTIDRVRKSEVSTKLETVEKLADALGVSAIALLTPHSDPASAAALAGDEVDPLAVVATSLNATCETAAEQRVLTAYRIADQRGRDAMDSAAESVLEGFQRAINDKR